MDQLTSDLVKMVWPIIGFMIVGLLTIIVFFIKRGVSHFDDLCSTLKTFMIEQERTNAEHEAELRILRQRCDITQAHGCEFVHKQLWDRG